MINNNGYRDFSQYKNRFMRRIRHSVERMVIWLTGIGSSREVVPALLHDAEKCQRLYEQAQSLPKEAQGQRGGGGRESWHIGITRCARELGAIALLFLSIITSTPAAVILSPGGSPTTIPIDAASGEIMERCEAVVGCTTSPSIGTFTSTELTSIGNCNESINKWGALGWSSDGKYYGFILGNDIIMSLDVSMSHGSTLYIPQGRDDTLTISSSGVITDTGSRTRAGCPTPSPYAGSNNGRANYGDYQFLYPNRIRGSAILYAGPNAAVGKYPAHLQYNIGIALVKSIIPLLNETIQIVPPPRTCTINLTPQNIDFGANPLPPTASTAYEIKKMQQLTINCKDGNATDPVSFNLVFQSVYATSSSTAALTRGDGVKMGIIRASSPNIANNNGTVGGDFVFSGNAVYKLAGNNWASTTANIEWRLTRINSTSPAGQGTGKVTLQVDWP